MEHLNTVLMNSNSVKYRSMSMACCKGQEELFYCVFLAVVVATKKSDLNSTVEY